MLVTGSREYRDTDHVSSALRAAITLLGAPVRVRHGDGQGLDRLADHAASNLGLSVLSHPAKWTTHADTCPSWCTAQRVCRLAGPRRNQAMIDAGNDLVFAFPLHPRPATGKPAGSRGTWHTVQQADRAGLPVLIVSGGHVITMNPPAITLITTYNEARDTPLTIRYRDSVDPSYPQQMVVPLDALH